MKAIVCRRYGPPSVLACEDVEKPTPGGGDVLVAVRAASVNPLDWHLMRGIPYVARLAFGLRAPRTAQLGADVAGRVESVGRNVTQFAPGDAVLGSCRGAFAEFVCTPESAVVAKPATMTFEQAAAVPVAGVTALQALRDKGRLQPGQAVLINGAAGGVGTFAVQIAKALGATVTGVCSTTNVDLVRLIGADHVIDYTRDDFTADGRRYDVMLDCIGNHSLSSTRRLLGSTGTYVLVGGPNGRWVGPLALWLKTLVLSLVVSQRLAVMMARLNPGDLALLVGLIDGGQVTPVIDRRFPLDDVQGAIAYLEQGHVRGKVVIAVGDAGRS